MKISRIAALVAAAAAASGCSTVLGLEDRAFDPTFGAAADAGGAVDATDEDAATLDAPEEDATPDAPEEDATSDAAEEDAPADADASDAPADADADSPAGPSCAAYCGAIQSTCTSTMQQYVSLTVCNAICAALPIGDTSNPTGNTVACRQAEADLAQNEPLTYCSMAGPSGETPGEGTNCGTPCDAYCAIMPTICPTQYQTDLGGTLQSCKIACGQVPNLGPYATNLQTGNSVQCRLYHLGAATQDPALHCPHTVGASICK